MILAVHSVVGAAIANQFSFRWWSYPLAFLSHFLLDLIPHREYSLEGLKFGWRKKSFWLVVIKVFFDLFSGIIFIILFTKNLNNLFYVFLGAFFAVLPDGLSLISWLMKNQNFFRLFKGEKLEIFDEGEVPFYYKIQLALHFDKKNPPPLTLGILNQLIIFLTALALL